MFDATSAHRSSVELGQEQVVACNALECQLSEKAVLSLPDLDRPFIVETDANREGISAILMLRGTIQARSGNPWWWCELLTSSARTWSLP